MSNNLPRLRPGFRRKLPQVLIGGIAAAAGITVLAVASHGGTTAPAGGGTVTYAVTGSDARVTYGPAGSSLSGSVPMSVTQPLGTPVYYAISAQLQGAGSVTCEIDVNGAPVSVATAAGDYELAMCEITRDPLTGQWRDANSG